MGFKNLVNLGFIRLTAGQLDRTSRLSAKSNVDKGGKYDESLLKLLSYSVQHLDDFSRKGARLAARIRQTYSPDNYPVYGEDSTSFFQIGKDSMHGVIKQLLKTIDNLISFEKKNGWQQSFNQVKDTVIAIVDRALKPNLKRCGKNFETYVRNLFARNREMAKRAADEKTEYWREHFPNSDAMVHEVIFNGKTFREIMREVKYKRVPLLQHPNEVQTAIPCLRARDRSDRS